MKESILILMSGIIFSPSKIIEKDPFLLEINQNAPVVSTKSVYIDASPEKVWAVLTDINNWENWQEDIEMSKLKGAIEPGNSFVWKSEGFKIKSKFHTVVPAKKLGWSGKSLSVKAIHNWSMEVENGRTKVMIEESMEGALAIVFRKSFGKKLNTGMENWCLFLKEECENQVD